MKKLLIIDIEATCWKVHPPPIHEEFQCEQRREIIEIGIAVLNSKTEKIEKSGSILVKPCYSCISKFCTKLTGITQNDINKKGISFWKACRILKNEYQSEKHAWMSLGYFDKNIMEQNCHLYNVKYPLSKRWINIKNLVGATFKCSEKGLVNTLKMLNLKPEGRHHSGVDDAINEARIVKETLWNSQYHLKRMGKLCQ